MAGVRCQGGLYNRQQHMACMRKRSALPLGQCTGPSARGQGNQGACNTVGAQAPSHGRCLAAVKQNMLPTAEAAAHTQGLCNRLMLMCYSCLQCILAACSTMGSTHLGFWWRGEKEVDAVQRQGMDASCVELCKTEGDRHGEAQGLRRRPWPGVGRAVQGRAKQCNDRATSG